MALAKDEHGNPTERPLFRLYLQTKLPNPHYIPELQAQCTLVNFTVTERGLEDQLLAVVVNKERPDLEEQRAALVEQQNQFTIRLKELEDDLLHRLATAEGDILGDEELIVSLENTKATVLEISEKVGVAKATSLKINEARETYRPVAARGSLIYFLIDQLHHIDHMYQFSLAAFNFIYSKALDKAARPDEQTLEQRTAALLDSATFTCFSYVTRGLFERHRLIFALQLAIRVLQAAGDLDAAQVDLLVKPPSVQADNPVDSWLSDSAWCEDPACPPTPSPASRPSILAPLHPRAALPSSGARWWASRSSRPSPRCRRTWRAAPSGGRSGASSSSPRARRCRRSGSASRRLSG